jgi:shikimate dehydrogenase
LAQTLACPWHPLNEISELTADCLINATSVGMAAHTDVSLVPKEFLSRFSVVMDIVYAPLKTRLLLEAEAAGCEVVDGLKMLLYQGAAQFKLWTGMDAPLDVMREVLHRRFA